MIGGLRIAVVSTIAIATIAAIDLRERPRLPDLLRDPAPDPFKTEIYSAGVLAVALALLCDAALILVGRAVTPWARATTR